MRRLKFSIILKIWKKTFPWQLLFFPNGLFWHLSDPFNPDHEWAWVFFSFLMFCVYFPGSFENRMQENFLWKLLVLLLSKSYTISTLVKEKLIHQSETKKLDCQFNQVSETIDYVFSIPEKNLERWKLTEGFKKLKSKSSFEFLSSSTKILIREINLFLGIFKTFRNLISNSFKPWYHCSRDGERAEIHKKL